MDFLNGMRNHLNQTQTLNGANALKSTQSPLVDLFAVAGALRNRPDIEIENLFAKAYAENPLLALKLLFYTRDVRGGLGERRVARILYQWLSQVSPEALRKNLPNIGYYGRWDDLLVLMNTRLKKDVIEMIRQQLNQDMLSASPSLMAKWLPSINTSSAQTREYARQIVAGLGWSAKKYRQTVAQLRKRLDVVEVKMSANQWEAIAYEKVPSNAMNNYGKAFMTQDEERFAAYIEAVKNGETTINASVLYPYNITEKILYGSSVFELDVLEQQWKSLPDYVLGDQKNVLIMADVSGSMMGRPMATSIGLALYYAQRTEGLFANCYMTFSESPSIVEVQGNTLYEQVRSALSSPWGMNTNFEKALRVILDTAIQGKARQEEMPESLVVITDMQFDQSLTDKNRQWTFYRKMKEMYKRGGYKIPEIIFWNVNSVSNVYQVSAHYEGVKMASGQSPSVFQAILESTSLTPYDYMIEVLSRERYQQVAL